MFHVSQITPYHDGADVFPSRTPISVDPDDVAHLDGWEDDNKEYAVSKSKAAKDPATGKMTWLVGFRGYAADEDQWLRTVK